ncbi:hypothetical protein [Halobacillus aidingensis]|uniref:Uncharacterized protein n=1 Tax=Halobacillus aidingensis TaxID=240303 RepID=A0A1H0JE44_HALAD|nr:hypothetical protein [Halobacillus aidingensis]SDO41904.1 hypothetical protein SAMN05421677_1052 [Halobacillus aidingensis]
MSRYLDRIEPEDVRFLMDLSEFKTIVLDMLGEARNLVNIQINYDFLDEPEGDTLVRPMVQLNEISKFTEEDRHTLLKTGFSIDGEPFDNGDYAMEQIFGAEYTILAITEDEDGAFFTIEMPYRNFERQKSHM